jgi:hypothetical protein
MQAAAIVHYVRTCCCKLPLEDNLLPHIISLQQHRNVAFVWIESFCLTPYPNSNTTQGPSFCAVSVTSHGICRVQHTTAIQGIMITHLTYEGRQPGHPLLDSLLVRTRLLRLLPGFLSVLNDTE